MFRLLHFRLARTDLQGKSAVASSPLLSDTDTSTAPHLYPEGVGAVHPLRRILLVAGAWAVILAYLYCIPYAAEKGGDFVHLWIGGHTVATGHVAQLYEPAFHKEVLTNLALPFDVYWGARYEILGVFFYPPLTGLLYSPIGALPLYWAQATQALLNIGLGLLAAWLLTKILQHRLRFSAVVILLFTFPSFFYAYVLGQNGILTMTLVLAGWYALTQRKPGAAGMWWSFLLFKPNWLLALGWLPLVQRQWRMIGGMIGGILGLLGLMIGTLGLAPLQAYVEVFTTLTDLHHLPQYPLESQYSILSLFRRYFGMGTTADLFGWAAVAGIVGITMWLAWSRQASSPTSRRGTLTTALGLVAGVSLNPHLHHYDLLLISAAGIVALSEWHGLRIQQRLLLCTLFAFHQVAFLLTQMSLAAIPLPIFAMLALWGWLVMRLWPVERTNPSTEIAQAASTPALIQEGRPAAL